MKSISGFALPPERYEFGTGLSPKAGEQAPGRKSGARQLGAESLPRRSPNRFQNNADFSKFVRPKGLISLHYAGMQKVAQQREVETGVAMDRGPTMERPWSSTAGYSGFVPGKYSNNIFACSHNSSVETAFDQTAKGRWKPMGGVTFTVEKLTPHMYPLAGSSPLGGSRAPASAPARNMGIGGLDLPGDLPAPRSPGSLAMGRLASSCPQLPK